MSRSEVNVKIVNVVVSVALRQKLDLKAIVKALPFMEYHPERFPGAILRLRKPRTVTLIFSTGKMVSVGAKSERQARSAVKKVIKGLKKGGIIITGTPEITVQNIVAHGSLGGSVDLLELCELERSGKVMYEPDQFPAAIYRMNEPRAVILIFASGKIVCTGVRKEKELSVIVEKLLHTLEEQNLIYRQ